MMSPEIRERLIEAFSRPVVPDLVQKVHIALRQRIFERYPHAQGSVPEAMVYLPGYEAVCSGSSGNRWVITFDQDGRHVPDARFEDGPADVFGCRTWEIAASGRAPLLCAIERWGINPRTWSDLINPIGADLRQWAVELCADSGLEYVDANELVAWRVPEKILTQDMIDRMGYTEDPNAFQLLFHE